MTTHGRFNEVTMATAKDVLPEPELPATPMMLVLAHGGLYRARFMAMIIHSRLDTLLTLQQ